MNLRAPAVLVALVMCLAIPGTHSIWMDEYEAWLVAVSPTPMAAWTYLNENSASETLMPLGMLNSWVALHVFGGDEWRFRCVNILWAALAVFAFARLGRRWQIPCAPLLFAVQPFLWYYGNEARPYVMQIACGSWLLLGVVMAADERRIRGETLAVLVVAGGVLLGTTLFGILTVGPAIAAVAFLAWRNQWLLPSRWKLWVALALIWCGIFGTHYLVSLKRGAAGARLWDVGLQNIAFAFYEFAGFSGLGPGRAEIREAAVNGGAKAALQAIGTGLIPIGLLGLGYIILITALWRKTMRSPLRAQAQLIAFITSTSTVALVALALIARFPFWGRHLAPVFPFCCALVILGLRDVSTRRLGQFFAVGFTALLLTASLLLRFSPRHGRDDYRGAVALARELAQAGRTIWWAADVRTARYYGMHVENGVAFGGRLQHVSTMSAEELATRSAPEVIITSKPDMYDQTRAVANFATKNGYRVTRQLNAFRVLERHP